MLSTFLASRPLSKEQTAEDIQELLFVFHEGPEGWREQLGVLFPSTPQGDQLWYWQIQQDIWHFSDNATMPNLLPASYVQRIERIVKGEEPSMIPASKKVEVRPSVRGEVGYPEKCLALSVLGGRPHLPGR